MQFLAAYARYDQDRPNRRMKSGHAVALAVISSLPLVALVFATLESVIVFGAGALLTGIGAR